MMTFQEYHDAIRALCPEGGSFSAGLTAWTNRLGREHESREVVYEASVHALMRGGGTNMVAHTSAQRTAEGAVEAIRALLTTPADYAEAVATAVAPSAVGQAPPGAEAGAPQRASVAQEDCPF